MNNETFTFEVIKGKQFKEDIYTLFVDCHHPLLKYIQFDRWHWKNNPKGYQRDDDAKKRGKNFILNLAKDQIGCTSSIRINVRGDVSFKQTSIGKEGQIRGELTIDRNTVFAFDGQGGTIGFLDPIAEELFKDKNYSILFVIKHVSRDIERKECNRVNAYQANMKSPLKHVHVLQEVKKEGLKNVSKNIANQALSQSVLEQLHSDSESPFFLKFIMANEKKQSSAQRIKNRGKDSYQYNTVSMSSYQGRGSLPYVCGYLYEKLCSKAETIDEALPKIYPIIKGYYDALSKNCPSLFKKSDTLCGTPGYHMLTAKGAFISSYLLKAMLINLKPKQFRNLNKYIKRSKRLRDLKYWEINPNKQNGIQVASTTNYYQYVNKILNEMGLPTVNFK